MNTKNIIDHRARGKAADGTWVYGSLLTDENGDCIIIPIDYDAYIHDGALCIETWTKVLPETVCKCMGAKDRKGNFIFQGDVLARFDTPTKPQYVVLWDSEKFAWTIKSFDGSTTVTATQSNCHALVICGNIDSVTNVLMLNMSK